MTKNPEEFTLEEIQDKVQKLDGWDNEDTKKIHKTFTFDNFVQALEFTNKVGEVAEEKQHHPDIHLTWGEVTIEIQTHQTGNLTDADFELAEQIDQIN
jgi:4a-hydroxytetrahydrobiopterin dehydratase